jgi:sulfur-oxidizing protein SoxY
MTDPLPQPLTRRQALGGMLATLSLLILPIPPALADDASAAAAITETFGTKEAIPGGITVTVPPLAESGNTVPITVLVDSPMTETDRARRVVIFSTRNPRPVIASMLFGPGAPRAEFSTNIRLSGTQDILVYAEMNNGTVRQATVRVEVIVGACDTLQIRY